MHSGRVVRILEVALEFRIVCQFQKFRFIAVLVQPLRELFARMRKGRVGAIVEQSRYLEAMSNPS